MADSWLRPIRMLALDVDGTLLDPGGSLSASTADAIARAAQAGIQPVLCTGRRYRRARPVAEQLGLDAPLVCNSGALVKDPRDHRTLWRADFPPQVLARVLALFQAHDHAAVSFTDRPPEGADFIVASATTGREHFDEFVEYNRPHAEIDAAWQTGPIRGLHFHLCALGTREAMLAFEAALVESLAGQVRTFVQKTPRYSGTVCEVLRHDASKWAAVLHLAEMWGISPAHICAVGDDMNDVPMIEGAGLGVAMGHAPAAVQAAADLVIPGQDHDGLASLVNRILLA